MHNLVSIEKEKLFEYENYDETHCHGLKLRTAKTDTTHYTDFGRHLY